MQRNTNADTKQTMDNMDNTHHPLHHALDRKQKIFLQKIETDLLLQGLL